MSIRNNFKIILKGERVKKGDEEYNKYIPVEKEPVVILKERPKYRFPDKIYFYIGDGASNIEKLYPVGDNFSVKLLKKIAIILSLSQIIQFLILLFLIL